MIKNLKNNFIVSNYMFSNSTFYKKQFQFFFKKISLWKSKTFFETIFTIALDKRYDRVGPKITLN